MGSILRDNRNFDRLDNIREYYADAFSKHSPKIEKILSERALDSLNVVRTLIVHRASLVDNKYLQRTKNLASAPKAQIGGAIILDGEIVSGLVQPVVELGCALIVAVDRWIASH
jgi:tagatose-1,6-bisphosphate aldolase